MAASLVVQNVCKRYGAMVALQDVSLTIAAGEILALLGPNGSGKTTLVKVLATLLAKDSGRVQLLGHDLDAEEDSVRQLIGYVGQDSERSAYARLTVRENLRFFGALRGLSRRAADTSMAALADELHCSAHLDQLFMTLSGGQKQVAVIMRAFLADPPLILLDEPTKGLDPFMARRVQEFLLRRVTEHRRAVLLTSHALQEVDELSHRVSLLQAGLVTATGTPDELKTHTGWQGVLEIPSPLVTAALDLALRLAGHHPKGGASPPGWLCYGLAAGGSRLGDSLRVLQEHGLERAYRYRPVSLADAFEHHMTGGSEPAQP